MAKDGCPLHHKPKSKSYGGEGVLADVQNSCTGGRDELDKSALYNHL
jgi:hypothetical protein